MAAITAAFPHPTEAATVRSAGSREGLLAAAAVRRSGAGILLETGLPFSLGRADG